MSGMSNQVRRELERHLVAMETVQIPSRKDLRRLFFMRPSSFPYCGLRFMLDFQQRWDAPQTAQWSSSFYFDIGSTIHSLFQRFTSKKGKMVGDWTCLNKSCRHVIKFTTYTECPKCGFEMLYDELTLSYRRTVLGHSDDLYRMNV